MLTLGSTKTWKESLFPSVSQVHTISMEELGPGAIVKELGDPKKGFEKRGSTLEPRVLILVIVYGSSKRW